jgi:transposase
VGDEFRRLALLAVRDFLAGLTCVTVANRVVALVLLLGGLTRAEVSRVAGTPRSTACDLMRLVEALGSPAEAAGLLEARWAGGRANPLAGEAGERLLEEMRRRNFFTLRQIREWLLGELGVVANAKTLSRFLHEHGFGKRKCGSIPARAREAEQGEFWRGTLEPLLREAEAGLGAVLFCDASHFVVSCDFLGSVWCTARRFIRTLSGRNRYNVLGALDWVTLEMTTVTNCDYINAESVLELLAKVREAYGDRKVTLVLDNARYQKCKVVWERAEELGVELLYIPPYSPNLNLIERVWHYVKAELRTREWDDFKQFRDRIDELVASTSGDAAGRIRSLMGEGAQLFDAYEELFEGTYEVPSRRKAAA